MRLGTVLAFRFRDKSKESTGMTVKEAEKQNTGELGGTTDLWYLS